MRIHLTFIWDLKNTKYGPTIYRAFLRGFNKAIYKRMSNRRVNVNFGISIFCTSTKVLNKKYVFKFNIVIILTLSIRDSCQGHNLKLTILL